MKKTTLRWFVMIPFALFSFILNGQNALQIWNEVSIQETANNEIEYRNTVPEAFQLHSLDKQRIVNALSQAPMRFSGISNTIIELPTVNGEFQTFLVYEAPVLDTQIQEEHPNIRSYVGQGIDDPTAIARFSYSNTGLHAMISSSKHSTVYIDPYTKNQEFYISYAINTLPADTRTMACMVEENTDLIDIQNSPENADDGMLRTFRLALACTGEYAQFHLNNQGIDPNETDQVKKAAVLDAMNTAMTRVNGVYERDLAVTMVIIDNNTDVIFLNGATDPYTNNNGATMLGQNQTTCDNIIGDANYDIGHVFSTGGGGIAALRSPCNLGNKARGVTGLPSPINDIFYIDFVSHEMGHQFGANHTQNNNCQRNITTAMEPGSASTIMGYAGICPPNVQNNSDDYFHAISIQEMWAFVSIGNGQCGAQSETGNSPPTAEAGPDHTIPKSTPFLLTGTATDPDDGDSLTHSWEQMDNNVGTMPPQNTSIVGPMFRSIDPFGKPYRFMPAINTVLNGQTQSTWEVVPSVARTMEFRYTVRDNVAGGASSASDDMEITVDGNSGPFIVTSQETATTWQTQTTETITWDVANTDIAPVNSSNVDIIFSIDGGQTYPVYVAWNIPNTGTADVETPNLNTTQGRFMVIGHDNIFFNVNGGIITVEGELSAEDFAFDNFKLWPNPSQGTVNLTFNPQSQDKVQVDLYDLRGRLINTKTYLATSSLFEQTLNYDSIDSGLYFVKVSNNGLSQTEKLLIN